MSKDMDKLRGMALATRAKALAEQAETGPTLDPVIRGLRLPGALPKGQLRSHVTTVGRARRGLVAHMLAHMPRETLATLSPGQRAAIDTFKKTDGGR